MADQNPMADPRVVPLCLPPEQAEILRSDLFGGLSGALTDLQHPEGLSDPAAVARDGAIFARLLEAIDFGEVRVPDTEARARIERLAEGFDHANDYPTLAAVHDAHRALIAILAGGTGR